MEGKPSLFSILTKRMDWLGQRQRVITANIANADTPEFVPRDMEASSFRRQLARTSSGAMTPAATNGQHIQTSQLRGRTDGDAEAEDRYETAPSGNAVVLEEQLIKMTQTRMHYEAMTNLYKKHAQMFKTALRSPR